MRKQKNNPKGFSIIEVLATVTFLSVIVFGVIRLETSNIALGNTQKLNTDAWVAAMQGAEIAEAIGYSGLMPGTYYLRNNGAGYTAVEQADPTLTDADRRIGDFFTRSVQIAPVGVGVGAYLATVTVSWTDNTGDHNVQAKRIIYE